MSSGFVGALSVVLLVSMTPTFVFAGPQFEPLEEMWNEHMLTGTEGRYASGEPGDYKGTDDYQWAEGAIGLAVLTNRGINVSDRRGVRFLGLVPGVGWSIRGGLLARARVNDDFLELYGRLVARWSGGFLGLDTYAKHKDHRYEFFLLHRPVGAPRATIVQKWSLPPEEIQWKVTGGHEGVRGYLTYDAAIMTAVVRFTGLLRPHEYRVDVADAVRKP